MKTKTKIFLAFIIFLAFLLRIWQVGQIPTFISDEASIGYNAYSILRTGRDEWGQFLPLSFKSFGEYKLPLYIYSAVPSIALFGLSELATRLPSVLAGVASVFLIFLIGRQLFSEKVGLLAAFLLAINPWHFGVSRMALEANLALAMVLAAIYLLLLAEKSKKALFLSFFLFTLSFYTYNSCRLFVPLFLFLYFLFKRKTWAKILKRNWLVLVMVLVLSLPIFLSGFQGSSQRLAKVGIFVDPGIISRVEGKRAACLEENSYFLCRVFYNRPLTYFQIFTENYFSHFSLEYLFFKGSGLAQYSVPESGALYSFELPFLVLGMIFLLKKRERESLVLLGSWLLVAPIANSLTGEAHPVRALVLLPVFPMISALGLDRLFSMLKRKKARILLSLIFGSVILAFFVSYLINYFIFSPQQPGSTWQEGYKALYQKLKSREADFDKILVTKFYGEPHIFYLFYQKFDPQTYQENQEVVRYDRVDGWVNVDQIGKYYFQDEVEILKGPLYGLTPKEANGELKVLDQVAWKNGQVSFLIGKANEKN